MSDQNPPDVPPSGPVYPGYPATQTSDPGYSSYPRGGPQYDLRSMPPASKTKAMWALILAIIPAVLTWIAAIILAIQVLSDSRDGRQHGKGMAIAALVIIPLWIAVIVAIIVADVADDADRGPMGEVTRSGEVLVNDVRAGDCVVKGFNDEVMYTVDVTPCTKPHALEAYANFDLAAGDYPGDNEVERLTTVGCVKRFRQFVGVDAEKSDLQISYILPVKESWDEHRQATCMVGEGKASTGSLEHARR
jgi:hypothetical protein